MTAQLPLAFPETAVPSPELLRSHRWLGFTLDQDEDAAARKFETRFGVPPAFIAEFLGVLFVGPIPVGSPPER
jgi:hypothetical protein